MIRTQVYLQKELYQEVSILARRVKKARAQVIRELLERGLRQTKIGTIGEGLQELVDLGKKLNLHGPIDLSTNHDKYLYEEE